MVSLVLEIKEWQNSGRLWWGPGVPVSSAAHQFSWHGRALVDYQSVLGALQLDLCLNEMCLQVWGTPHKIHCLQTPGMLQTLLLDPQKRGGLCSWASRFQHIFLEGESPPAHREGTLLRGFSQLSALWHLLGKRPQSWENTTVSQMASESFLAHERIQNLLKGFFF